MSAAMGEQLSTTETFGEFFDWWLGNRRPYLEAGTYTDYDVHGRHRLASLRPIKLTKLSPQAVETWLAGLAAQEHWAPKTIDNALATLVACLNGWNDLDFDNGAIRVLRSGKRDGDGSTKGDRFVRSTSGRRSPPCCSICKPPSKSVVPVATARCYGHLEATFLKGAAAETEAAIWGASGAR